VKRSLHKSRLITLFTRARYHNLTLTTEFSNLWKHCYRFTHTVLLFTQFNAILGLPLSACHCLAALPAKMSVFNSHMQGSHSVISNKPRSYTKNPYSYNKTQKLVLRTKTFECAYLH